MPVYEIPPDWSSARTVMPLPFVELNSATMSLKPFARTPVWLCHSVTSTGPLSEMSASVLAAGAACSPGPQAPTRIAAIAVTSTTLRMVLILPVFPSRLAADPRPGDTFDEVALRDEVDDERRQDHKRRACHEQMVSRASLARELHQHHLDRPDLGPRRDDQRPEERVPRVEEREQRNRDEGGSHQRQADGPEKAEVARAVDPRGVVQLLRHREKELTQQEDRENADEERDDLCRIGVVPPEVAATHEHEVRDDRCLGRDEKRRQQQREQDASSAEAHARERVAGENGGCELADRRHRRDEDRVRESVRPERVRVLPGLDPVLGMPGSRP